MYRYPFRGSVEVASGRLTAGELRGPRFRRLFPDVYISSVVHMNHYLWCRAASLLAGDGAVLSGLSAAHIWGVDAAPEQVEVTVGLDRRIRAPGLLVRRAGLDEEDQWRRRGLPVTSVLRTTFDLARRLPRTEALIAVDAMMAKVGLSIADLDGYIAKHRGLRGVRRAAALVPLVEPLTESPMESVCRLGIVDGGLPRPVAQFIVIRNGLFLARLDLAYPRWLIGIEYEGDHHRDRATFRRDIARYRALEDAGWAIVRLTADDVLRKSDEMIARILRLINSRRR